MINIRAGLTSQTIDIFIPSSASTTGAGLTGLVFNSASLTAYYRKGATGTATAITLATQTVGGAYSSGGFVEIDATNMPGMYRLDLPNAAIDTAGLVHIQLKGATNMAPVLVRINCDLVPADTRSVGGTTQTARDLGASVLLSSGTGTGQISLTSGLVTLAGVTHTGAVIPTVTTTTTATNLTNLPSIPANWLTAAGIAASALDGKGNWNVGKTGYSLTATTGLGNQTANITGNLSGSVGSVTGAVASVTGAVGSVTAAVTVGTINANVITATSIAAAALNGKGDWNIGKTGYALTATTGLGNQTANITGNLSGSVGSVTGNVGGSVASVTGAVGSVTGNVGGNVVGSVASVTNAVTVGTINANTITAASIASAALNGKGDWNVGKTGYSLAAAGLDSIVVETGLNARQALSVIAASAAGVLAGAATSSVTIAAAGVPATNRITATVDADGNRSAVTLSPPA